MWKCINDFLRVPVWSVLIGAAVALAGSLPISWCFYVAASKDLAVVSKDLKAASKDLKAEAAKIQDLNLLILHAMENGLPVTLRKDSAGNPIGLIIDLSGAAKASAEAQGTLGKPER